MKENDKFKVVVEDHLITISKISDIDLKENESEGKNIFYTDSLPRLIEFIDRTEINRYNIMSDSLVTKWTDISMQIAEDERKNTIEKALKIFRSDIPVEKIKDDSELQKKLEKVIRLGRAAGISIQL